MKKKERKIVTTVVDKNSYTVKPENKGSVIKRVKMHTGFF